MSIHNPEQLRAKKESIDVAVVNFIKAYKSGQLSENAILFFEIESLCQLVAEYKRG